MRTDENTSLKEMLFTDTQYTHLPTHTPVHLFVFQMSEFNQYRHNERITDILLYNFFVHLI